MYGKSDPDPETNSYLTTYYFVALFIPVFPIARYRIIEVAGNRYSFLGKAPLRKVDRWHLGIAIVVVLAGVFGVAMSPEASPSRPGISTSRSPQLTTLKARIDQGRVQSSALESQLQPVLTQLTNMNDQLKKISAELKTLDEQSKAGLPIDTNEYNAKVEIHNQILGRRKELLAANHEDLQKYDSLLKQDSALVDEYNGLLKAGSR